MFIAVDYLPGGTLKSLQGCFSHNTKMTDSKWLLLRGGKWLLIFNYAQAQAGTKGGHQSFPIFKKLHCITAF